MSEMARAKAYEYLSQRLARKHPELSLYALNKRAKALAYLRFLKRINENMSLYDVLNVFFEEIGHAESVSSLDPLSQLGIKTGSLRQRVSEY